MYFTDDQLSNDPELRPKTWRSTTTFERERLILLDALADILHETAAPAVPPTTTMPSSTTIASVSSSSSSKSLISSSPTIAIDPEKTPRPTSSIFSNTFASSITSTPRSVSSFFNLPFGSSSRISVDASTGLAPHTPIIFSSPQTSTFAFETANPSPAKVDSVMGSPIRFVSPRIFKRKNKKNAKENDAASEQGSVAGVPIEEGNIFSYFKAAVGKKDDSGSDTHDAETETNDNDGDNETSKGIDSGSGLDEQGKEYVVEALGLAVTGEPQSLEHQFRFVKKQMQMARQRFLCSKL